MLLLPLLNVSYSGLGNRPNGRHESPLESMVLLFIRLPRRVPTNDYRSCSHPCSHSLRDERISVVNYYYRTV
jgi:hypothetical protein